MATREGPLTPENLLDTAPELAALFNGYEMRPMNPQDVAGLVLGPIPEHFPDLVKVFLARGLACIAYSGFHYILATVGFGQFGLAAEAAIREYTLRKGLEITTKKGSPKGFHNLIRELHAAKHLTDEQLDFWSWMVKLRNHLLHPQSEMVASYGMIFGPLQGLTEEMLLLFPSPRNS